MIRFNPVLILFSLCAAFVLSIVYLPSQLQFWRPDWSALVILFWVYAAPHRIGVFFSWTVGLFQDVLEGSTLGMNAFAYAVMAYLLVSMYQRFKLFPLIQQSFMVFMLIGIDLMICHLVKSVTGVSASGFVYLYPAITSAAIWPFFYLMMSNLTRKLG
ncbi:MAG: rod shape-determining protein MreD [Hahellaceae bacterium]|nr:rod shape-determining protein MreD [Hahellaceae bacterium]MCP5211205.1 rod shape-determining protein MreD [Hahellaceae bacterium]